MTSARNHPLFLADERRLSADQKVVEQIARYIVAYPILAVFAAAGFFGSERSK